MQCVEPSPGSSLPEPSAIEAAVALFGALAHRTRLTVLLVLARQGALTVGELMAATDSEQSAMSHQLRALRDARLVVAKRDGRRIRYQLHDQHVAHIVQDALVHAVDEVMAERMAHQ